MMLRAAFLSTLTASASAFASSFATPRIPSSLKSTAAVPHDVESGVGPSWAGARYGDEFLSTGHWSQSETSGETAANAMDAAAPPRARSSHTGHAYSATTTHGTTAANAMDAPAPPRARSSHTGHAYSATETHGETAANAMDAAAPPRARSSHTGHAYAATETHGETAANAMDAAAPPRARSSHTGHAYSATTTHAKSDSVTGSWVSGFHAEAGNGYGEWSGARYGDYGGISKRAAPTPSQWLE